MIRRMPFDPVVTGFAHLSCAGSTDAEALAMFRGERPPETPRPALPSRQSASGWTTYCSACPFTIEKIAPPG